MASTAIVDPRLDVHYGAIVLHSLAATGCRVRFRKLGITPVGPLAAVINGVRWWIDLNDPTGLSDSARWADRVAKVNTEDPAHLALGPLFGVTHWPLPFGYGAAASLALRGAPLRSTLAHFRFQGITRRPLSAYAPSDPSKGEFVALRARPWSGKHSGTNAARERFAAALTSVDVEQVVSFSEERVGIDAYLAEVRRSAVVFNSPAVHGCLGWKLGEYLALGKAIISVSLGGRRLPADLVHGEHVHFVEDDVDAMRDALELILHDDGYRRHLEVGARRWYDEQMSPAVVAARLTV